MTHSRFLAIVAALLGLMFPASGADPYGPHNLPPCVHPPVMEPIPDGIKLVVPKELGNRELAKLGLVDVTAAPFGADPAGERDSTAALQRAIDFARDAQMVCFFPTGVYAVSDTLQLRHGIHMRSHRATFINNRNMPCVLMGSRKGEGVAGYSRPKIVLREDSPGFSDVDNTKPILEHWLYRVKRFAIDKTIGSGGGGSLMNTMFVNVDVVIGRGNPGATGMHIRSVEGSGVQDVTIDATHGHTGIEGAASNGGSWTNVTVIGGRIGLDVRGWTPPTPTMAGITLVNQTEAAIVSACRGPLTAVGLKIVSRIPGPVIVGQKTWGPFNTGMSLIDSEIVFDRTALKGRRTTSISAERSVYLNNVYVHGADTVVAGSLKGNVDGWLHVEEFALGKVQTPVKGLDLSAPIYVDGKEVPGPYCTINVDVEPPKDLQSGHVWGTDFPTWESPEAANVKAPPYNAKGDSFSDDTEALQQAVDENDVVFLPKGYYRITGTLKLRPNTKLIGLAQHLSVVMARDPDGEFGRSDHPKPLVETADDGGAETVIAFLGMRFPREVVNAYDGKTLPVYALKWSCGPKSVFRSNQTEALRIFGFKRSKEHKQPPMHHPSVLINGNGGGKWYNYHDGQFFAPTTRSQRAILIDSARGPLHFYNFEPQGGDGAAIAEIKNSRSISLYGCKTECDTTFLHVSDSDHIRIFGHGGIGNASAGGSLYIFERTPSFLIANIADQAELGPDKPYYAGLSVNRNIKTYYPLLDRRASGDEVLIPSLERPVLYRRGMFHMP
ncbi:MAG: hypothetical protein HN742_27915 [Lentisphaerae bacterium]|nr:hypothetical protein [Lentisphaerota bacterium]MBT4814735.1 hypothetical protein [Lentisphaerota bacterium]MBT5609860.1 hypothetical protein [Lentisphaerota bacterium]MBT7056523.1 hypothetical protein [Lentisphaerota bacterium]MBT7845731.1 hypothetical protein [Lentisphaerota bacterium]